MLLWIIGGSVIAIAVFWRACSDGAKADAWIEEAVKQILSQNEKSL